MTYLARPRPGELESLRTLARGEVARSTLTIGEQHQVSTYTTRQFTRLLWLAVLLAVLIASFSTVVATYDRVKASLPERRLLSIAGAQRSFAVRSIQLQNLTPLALAVPLATGASLLTAAAFTRLFAAEGGHAAVPLAGLASLAAISLAVPALAGWLVLASESPQEVLRTPE